MLNRTLVAAALGALAFSAISSRADDVSTGFVPEVNPNGPWRFGWVRANQTLFNVSFLDIEESGIYRLAADTWDVYPPGQPCLAVETDPVPPNHFWYTQAQKTAPADFWPGPVGQVFVGSGFCDLRGAVRYTVPASGRFRLEFAFEAMFPGQFAEAHVRIVGGPALFVGEVVSGDGAVEFSATLDLIAGQHVDVLMDNGDGVDDLVALNFTIDELAAADLDGDGGVGVGDLALLLGSWGLCAGECAADLDGDGVVGASDLAEMLGSWG